MDIRWNRKAASRGSDVAAEMRLPNSRMKAWPSAQMGPKVSMARGANRLNCISAAYLRVLRSAAASAAAPALVEVTAR